MGVTQALDRQMRKRGLDLAQLFYTVLPEVVTYRVARKNIRWGQDGLHPARPRSRRDHENRMLQFETLAVVNAVSDALLSLDPRRDKSRPSLRQRQSQEIERMLATNNPTHYVETLDWRAERAVVKRADRIRRQLNKPKARLRPGDALWLETRGFAKGLSGDAEWVLGKALERDMQREFDEMAASYDAYYVPDSDWSVEPHEPGVGADVLSDVAVEPASTSKTGLDLSL